MVCRGWAYSELEGVLGVATLQLIVFSSNDARCGGNQSLQDEGDSGDFERGADGGFVGDSVNHDVLLMFCCLSTLGSSLEV